MKYAFGLIAISILLVPAANSNVYALTDFKTLFNTDPNYQGGCLENVPDACYAYTDVRYQSNSSMILAVQDLSLMDGVGRSLNLIKAEGYNIVSMFLILTLIRKLSNGYICLGNLSIVFY